jgi:ferric-dicitrate binding protein FerR (iron transport regulator)
MRLPLTGLSVLAFALSVTPPAFAQGIAAVSACSGDVSILEAATRSPRPVTVLPDTGRVSGGTLATGDEVRTGAGASATVSFPDGSAFRLDASTRLAVSEAPIAARRPGDKSIRRQLRLDEGRVASDVKPSDSVYTALRSPAGLVGVRGTAFAVAFSAGRFQVSVDGGQVFLLDPAGISVLPLGAGQQAELQVDGAGVVTVRLVSDAGRPVSATIGDATAALDAGDALRLAPGADGALVVTVVNGPVTLTRAGSAQTLATGASATVRAETTAPAAAKTETEKPAVSAAPDEIPTLPAVRPIEDTVDASPMK